MLEMPLYSNLGNGSKKETDNSYNGRFILRNLYKGRLGKDREGEDRFEK